MGSAKRDIKVLKDHIGKQQAALNVMKEKVQEGKRLMQSGIKIMERASNDVVDSDLLIRYLLSRIQGCKYIAEFKELKAETEFLWEGRKHHELILIDDLKSEMELDYEMIEKFDDLMDKMEEHNGREE